MLCLLRYLSSKIIVLLSADIIEELISKGQQLDAINFAYEAALQDKFPPVPLLKSFLKDSKKGTSSSSEDRNSSGQAVVCLPLLVLLCYVFIKLKKKKSYLDF